MDVTRLSLSIVIPVLFMYLIRYIFRAPPERAEDIIAMLLQVGLTAMFLGVFFFTYVAKVEGEVTTSQINYIVDSFTKDMGSFIPPQLMPMVDDAMATMQPPDMRKEDEMVMETNKKLMSEGFQLLAIPCVLCVMIFFAYMMVRPVRPTTLWLVFFSLAAVAVTYVLFLMLVVKQYLTVDTNKIKMMIVGKLEDIKRKGSPVLPPQ